MESLYVCLFSNGHIKVGRSIEPRGRIAAHAERVACFGVELSDQFVVECVGPAAPREQRLIGLCAEAADRRNQSEWFEGLDFLEVCEWAGQAARQDLPVRQDSAYSFGPRLRDARKAAGLTQSQLARGMGAGGADLLKAAVCTWEMERNFPNTNQLRLICERLGVSADYLLFGERTKV